MQSTISWLVSFLALFGWGFGAPAAKHHQPQPQIQRQVTRVTASPTPLAVTPSPSPSRSATPTPSAAPAAAEIASEAACPGQSDMAKTVAALTCLTQNARKFHGLATVTDSQTLLAAATAKDQDMARCDYGHTACGQPFDSEIKAKGYTGRCYGENIAEGQQSPREVFVAWMNSPGHRANILGPQYRDLGVAEMSGSQGPLWVMELGGC